MTITYDQPDFLCVGPFCWGRAKTAREAFRLARSNASDSLTKPGATYAIWRLADQTDEVDVDQFGSFTVFPKDGCEQPGKPRLVWKGDRTVKIKDVPELLICEIER